ncbi:hypothetical protein MMC28_002765 [Mycoblastus sanguinarius]|nr:hypothetical protein [Mycoblastus sanguinarius]
MIDFLLGGGGFGHAPSGGPIPAPTVPQGQRFGQSEYPQNSRSFRRPNEETQQPKPARPKGVLKAKRPLNDHRISKNVKTANKTLNRAIRNWDAREEKEKKYQKTLEPILLRNPSIRAELVEPPGSRKRRHGLIEKELAPVDTIGVINSDRSLLATKDFDHGRRKRVRRVIEEDDCTENPHADFQSSIARSSEETTRVIQSESAMPIDQHPSQAGSHNPTRREAASGENLQPSLSTHGGTVPETSPSPVMFHYPTRELDARGSTGPFGSDPDIELKNHRKRVRELIGDPDCFGYLPEPKRRRTSLPVVPSTPASTLLQGKKGKSRVQRNNFPARVADYHRKAGQNLQHDESVAQNGVTQETAMPIITEFSDIVPFSLDMDQCIQDALSPIREMYFDATGSPAPETNQLDSYVLRYRKILAAWEKWSGTPVNYSEEPPLSSKEAQCIVDALLPTRMMFYEWTGEGAPKINRMNSYGDQFREIHAVFEEWWEANFLDPLPLLVGLNAWYGSMDNFESPVKDSLYYEAYKLGHRAPRDQYGRIENIYGPFLEDTTRNLFWW